MIYATRHLHMPVIAGYVFEKTNAIMTKAQIDYSIKFEEKKNSKFMFNSMQYTVK